MRRRGKRGSAGSGVRQARRRGAGVTKVNNKMNHSTHFVPSDDQKREALLHVDYTIKQFACAFLFLADSNIPKEQVVINALIESIALHTRILLDFFQASHRVEDDILSCDYDFPARPLELSGSIKDKVNKEAAHLTYGRIERFVQGKKEWPYNEFVPQICQRCIEFIDHVLERHCEMFTDEESKNWKVLRGMISKECDANSS